MVQKNFPGLVQNYDMVKSCGMNYKKHLILYPYYMPCSQGKMVSHEEHCSNIKSVIMVGGYITSIDMKPEACFSFTHITLSNWNDLNINQL